MHQELDTLRTKDKEHKDKIRELEIINTALEQSQRESSSLIQDLESKYNKLLEKTSLLENEIDDKSQVQEEYQRCKDELRGM